MPKRTRQEIIDLIKSIESKSLDAGCTEEEVMLACEMASRLREEYDITQQDFTDHFFDEKDTGMSFTKNDPMYLVFLTISDCLGCILSKVTILNKGRNNEFRASVFGHSSKIDLCMYLFDTSSRFVSQSISKMKASIPYPSLSRPMKGRYFTSFKYGLCKKMVEKIEAKFSEVEPSTAIVLSFEATKNAYNEMHPDTSTAKLKSVNLQYSSYQRGYQKGDEFNVYNPVGTSSPNLKLKGENDD